MISAGDNPLQWASISNILSPDEIANLSLSGISNSSELNQLLDDTTIKRACCLRDSSDSGQIEVKVKIPKPNKDIEVTSMEKNFNYLNKTVKINRAICKDPKFSDYSPESTKCDNFYASYCSNILNDYQQLLKETGKKYTANDWNQYSLDCACYGSLLDESGDGSTVSKATQSLVKKMQEDAPPKCYMPKCGQTGSYIDKKSRKGECNITVCQQIFDAGQISIEGENNEIANTFKMNCGSKYEQPKPVGTEPTQTEIAEVAAAKVPPSPPAPVLPNVSTLEKVDTTRNATDTATGTNATGTNATGTNYTPIFLVIGGVVFTGIVALILYKLLKSK